MECLKGYIGIKGCGLETSLSGKFVNSLPGISLKTFDKTANEEQQTFFGVWKDVEDRAIAKFASNVNTALASRFKLKSISQSINLGKLVKKDIVQPPVNQLKGFSIELRLAEYYKKSSLQSISIQTLSLFLLSDLTDATIKIIDIETNDVLDTFTFDGVVGWNLVQVNKRYDAQRLFIGFDSVDSSVVELPIFYGITNALNSACGIVYGAGNCSAYVRGAQTIAPLDATHLSYGNDAHGLSAVFSLVCKYDNLICNNKEAFATALWYLCGAELMVQALASSRLNWITLDKEKLNELKNYFEAEYEKELTNVIRGIDLDTSDACVECNAPVTIRESRM